MADVGSNAAYAPAAAVRGIHDRLLLDSPGLGEREPDPRCVVNAREHVGLNDGLLEAKISKHL